MNQRVRKILILAGEESGDLHGSYLVESLLKLSIPLKIFAMGGQKMKLSGAELLENTLESSVVGISEVLWAIPSLIKRQQRIQKFVEYERPDLIIFIDFPGFHLRLMPNLAGLAPMAYYIPPKVWVWKQNRALKILKFCKRIYTIFPFENSYFPNKASYFGHPLVDFVKPESSLNEFKQRYCLEDETFTVALVPGSRQQEIIKMLPRFCAAAKLVANIRKVKWLLPLADSISENNLPQDFLHDLDIQIIRGCTYDAIKHSDLIIATSGTVTLEATLLGTPMIICNRASWVTYMTFKLLSKIPYVGLPNIISNAEICPEMLQSDTEPIKLSELILDYLDKPQKLQKQKEDLSRVVQTLGEPGVVERVSNHMAEEFLQ